MYYTQGDYGLFQSSLPSGRSAGKTYENETAIREMVLAQGFSIAADGSLTLPDDRAIRMEIPADLAPICPDDGRMMTTNLRVDARFVQDAGWYAASRRYELFLEKRRMAKTLYWELGIGYNTQETGLLHTKMDKRQDMVISQKRLDTLRWRSGASRLSRCRAEERRCVA